jgi:hypothetical protein
MQVALIFKMFSFANFLDLFVTDCHRENLHLLFTSKVFLFENFGEHTTWMPLCANLPELLLVRLGSPLHPGSLGLHIAEQIHWFLKDSDQ